MGMFSTKPKFDLAAFLAEPAPKGARRAGNKGRGMQFRPSKAPEASSEPEATEAKATDKPAE